MTEDLEKLLGEHVLVVRKELARRYPKHSWPEDPTDATPQRKPGPRRSEGSIAWTQILTSSKSFKFDLPCSLYPQGLSSTARVATARERTLG